MDLQFIMVPVEWATALLNTQLDHFNSSLLDLSTQVNQRSLRNENEMNRAWSEIMKNHLVSHLERKSGENEY